MRYGLDTPTMPESRRCHWCGNSLRYITNPWKGKDCERWYCGKEHHQLGESQALTKKIRAAGMVSSHYLVSALILCVLMLAFIFTGGTRAWAQDGMHGVGHAENHDWYRELKQPGTGYSCCNGQTADDPNGDCRPTRAYMQDDGTWKALIDGQWQTVPPRTVLQRLAPDGNSHICASKSGMIYCFIGGSPKS